MPSSPAFDLYTRPWILVVRDGVETSASLRTCVIEAHLIDALSITDGPGFAGALRLLMALVMDAYGQPANDAEWADRRAHGSFDADTLDSYVDKVGSSRFDLFDPQYPFMQSATTPFEGKSVAELLPHVATGNRTPIWTPDTDATPRPLTFAQAARALVASHAVAVPGPGRAAGDDPKESWAGVSLAGRAGIIGFCCPIGDTLFETLLLNLPNGPHAALDPSDLPVWRRHDIPPSRCKRFADGMVDLLTWTPRRVRLIADGDTVSRVCFRGGDALPELKLDHEPHTALRRSDGKAGVPQDQWYPRKHLPHTLGWRGIPQLLALGDQRHDSRPPIVLRELGNRIEDLPPNYRVTIASMLVTYGNMSAVIDDISTDMYPLPVRAFGDAELDVRDALVDLVTTADQVRYLVRGYAQDLFTVTQRDLETNRDPKKDKRASKSYANTVEAQLVAQIDSITRRFLSDLAADPDKLGGLKTSWTEQLRALVNDTVRSVQADCGPNVFTVLAKDGKVVVYPPAVRESQLRKRLVDYLGDVSVEAPA
ncbi:Type I-E CRISPR-associated protein Cse1/CasA [Mycobacterium canetti]|uniref:type I-E CRISPR-associated protein Cse1/CasA n=1 Tax=Mycobacterium canetti TaxID=78331 RepID=UPI002D78E856|nr:type I-E CRISPR-associated protein Cse1/CasA [Mycobacterium canetti]WRO42893.1 Type I-E CRISPR-associated protein Cse1/CasA [Mycobacterium canetti]